MFFINRLLRRVSGQPKTYTALRPTPAVFAAGIHDGPVRNPRKPPGAERA